MLYSLQRFLVKIFDPSSCEAALLGPNTFTFVSFKKSTNPSTNGFSGPIIKKSILVVNKMDLGTDQVSSEIKKHDPIFISIKDEKNLDELINLIKENLKNKFVSSEDIFITRERHRINLEQYFESLKNFEEKKSLEDFDKAAEDLRLATRYLGIIVGKVDVEEILGSIFNDFCIGK